MEQQFLIDAVRFETSQLSSYIQDNVLKQLNRISHDIASRVASALGKVAPDPDPTYYHDNTTAGISIFGHKLPTIATLRVGVLASTTSDDSLSQAKALAEALSADKVTVHVVAESLADGVDQTYSVASAVNFDSVVVTAGAASLFGPKSPSTQFPPGRPTQLVRDAYTWGKPVAFLGASGGDAAKAAGVPSDPAPGVYKGGSAADIVDDLKEGLAIFKFTDRFPTDDK